MKIGDVEIGKEYGALDAPRSGRYGRTIPRQVKALEIVTVEETRYHGYTSGSTKVNKRRVKVEFLDGTEEELRGYRYDAIKKAARGATLVIEARQLVAPWSELRGDILARQREEEKRIAISRRRSRLGSRRSASRSSGVCAPSGCGVSAWRSSSRTRPSRRSSPWPRPGRRRSVAKGNPDSVEQWAPMFLRYYKEEQILNPTFAITFDHCKLCDDGPIHNTVEHLREHKKELRSYQARRASEARKKSLAGLAAARKEKQMAKSATDAADVIANLDNYPKEDEDA